MLRSTAVADRAMGMIVALAHSLTFPLEGLSEDVAVDPFDRPTVAKMTSVPGFRRPLNRAAAQSLSLGSVEIAPATLTRLGHDAASRLAVLLIVEDRREIETGALLVAAGVLQRRLLRLALKSDRERAVAVFGGEVFRTVTREAAVLYTRLAELDTDETPAAIFDNSRSSEEQSRDAIDLGIRIFGRFVAGVDQGLGSLFARRFGPSSIAGPQFTSAVTQQLLRFLQQGKPKWSDLIA